MRPGVVAHTQVQLLQRLKQAHMSIQGYDHSELPSRSHCHVRGVTKDRSWVLWSGGKKPRARKIIQWPVSSISMEGEMDTLHCGQTKCLRITQLRLQEDKAKLPDEGKRDLPRVMNVPDTYVILGSARNVPSATWGNGKAPELFLREYPWSLVS